MADDLVTAVWDGPFDGELPSGVLLTRGASYEIPRHQAHNSDHWRIVKKTAAAKPTSEPNGADS